MELTLKIADDSVAARNVEQEKELRQLSREEAAVRLLEEAEVSSGTAPKSAHPDAYKIIGAFSSPEDVKLMDEVMELIMEDRRRLNDGPAHD